MSRLPGDDLVRDFWMDGELWRATVVPVEGFHRGIRFKARFSKDCHFLRLAKEELPSQERWTAMDGEDLRALIGDAGPCTPTDALYGRPAFRNATLSWALKKRLSPKAKVIAWEEGEWGILRLYRAGRDQFYEYHAYSRQFVRDLVCDPMSIDAALESYFEMPQRLDFEEAFPGVADPRHESKEGMQ